MSFQQGEGPSRVLLRALWNFVEVGWQCDGVLCPPLQHHQATSSLLPATSCVSSQQPAAEVSTSPSSTTTTPSLCSNNSGDNTHSSFTLVIDVAWDNSEYPQPVVGYLNVLVIENNFHVKVSLTSSHYCYKN